MNREIKFRVWNNIEKCFDDTRTLEVFIKGGELHHMLDIEKTFTTIQQYTGIKDVNSKEVFEGDVVRLIGGTKCGVVEYSDRAQFGMNIMGYILPLINCDFEVVGNMFENGDLL